MISFVVSDYVISFCRPAVWVLSSVAVSVPAIRAAATDSTPSAEAAGGTGAGPGRKDETGKPVFNQFCQVLNKLMRFSQVLTLKVKI